MCRDLKSKLEMYISGRNDKLDRALAEAGRMREGLRFENNASGYVENGLDRSGTVKMGEAETAGTVMKVNESVFGRGTGGMEEAETSGLDVRDITDGAVCRNDEGACFVIERMYPPSYLYGGFSIGDLSRLELKALENVCADFDESLCVKDLLFLDTETTGLSGGTGTVAFLAGVGFFCDDAFVLRQYFMRDYDEEPAMLKFLGELIERFRALVTFNGKAFDWNILKGRFIFNRIKPLPAEPLHIDLLFPSRRIWKLKLGSCRLSSLEENILGECRVDDVPGELIPSIYFKYLESRDAADIKRVMKHNGLDVLSMAALLARICRILANPLGEAEDEGELMGVGRILENRREFDASIECYEMCVKSGRTSIRDAALRILPDIYKKSGDYEKAVRHWEGMIRNASNLSIYPMIELAKYYEHREKDIPRALETVEEAVRLSIRLGLGNDLHRSGLLKRLERLKRKAARHRD